MATGEGIVRSEKTPGCSVERWRSAREATKDGREVEQPKRRFEAFLTEWGRRRVRSVNWAAPGGRDEAEVALRSKGGPLALRGSPCIKMGALNETFSGVARDFGEEKGAMRVADERKRFFEFDGGLNASGELVRIFKSEGD